MRGERGLHELYRDDTERAAALVFGRRGLLKGAGLTAMAAVVGTAIVLVRSAPIKLLKVTTVAATSASVVVV